MYHFAHFKIMPGIFLWKVFQFLEERITLEAMLTLQLSNLKNIVNSSNTSGETTARHSQINIVFRFQKHRSEPGGRLPSLTPHFPTDKPRPNHSQVASTSLAFSDGVVLVTNSCHAVNALSRRKRGSDLNNDTAADIIEKKRKDEGMEGKERRTREREKDKEERKGDKNRKRNGRRERKRKEVGGAKDRRLSEREKLRASGAFAKSPSGRQPN